MENLPNWLRNSLHATSLSPIDGPQISLICRYDSHKTRTPPSPSCFALRSRPSPIFRVRSNAWRLKTYGKTALNEEIPVNKCQKKITRNMSKLVFIILKSSNCGQDWSIFCFNVHWVYVRWRRLPKDSTLDFWLDMDFLWFTFKKLFFQHLSC